MKRDIYSTSTRDSMLQAHGPFWMLTTGGRDYNLFDTDVELIGEEIAVGKVGIVGEILIIQEEKKQEQ